MIKFAFFSIAVILHILILSNLQFTAWPEVLGYPYLFANGFSLYKDMIVPYPPGLIWILASIYELFSYNPEVLKYFTWFLIISIDLLIILIFENLKIGKTAFFFFFLYIFLQPFLDGNMLWFDIATTPFLLLAFIFSINFSRNKHYKDIFWIGLFLGLAMLIKQIAIVYFFAFILWYLFFLTKKKKLFHPLIFFSLGLGIPMGFLLLSLNIEGVIWDFWNWTVFYPLTQWSKFPGYVAFEISRRTFVVLVLLFLPLLGLLLIKRKNYKEIFVLTILFFGATILAIYPRFSFFHFQPSLTLLIVFLAQLFTILGNKIRPYYTVLVISCFSLVIYLLSKQTIFSTEIRFYGEADKKLVKKIIQENSSNEKIFLLGPNSSSYALTGRLPPKPWADNFGWYLEIPGVQEWVIEGFVKSPPKTIYRTTPFPGNWFDLGAYQPKKILAYINDNYTLKERFENTEIWTKR